MYLFQHHKPMHGNNLETDNRKNDKIRNNASENKFNNPKCNENGLYAPLQQTRKGIK